MKMLWTIIGLVLAISAIAALNSQPQAIAGPQKAEESKEEKEDPVAKRASLTRQLHLAELKLRQAQLESNAGKRSADSAVEQAQAELSLAERKLVQFRELDSRQKIEEARLDLRGARDRQQEAAEELQQIELMYKDQDLDDRTAEFVIQRGRRNAERAAARIALSELGLQSLVEHEVPTEIRQRELNVTQKRVAYEAAKRARESHQLKSQISVATAESEIHGLREKLVGLGQ